MSAFRARFAERWLRFPRALWGALGLSALLALPALLLGRFMDDIMHAWVVRGFPSPFGRWEMFSFASGRPAELAPFIERGPFPWWTHPELKFTFWRPLSSALIHFDYALFGEVLPFHHLHSILWGVALVAAASLLYRRALPGAVAAGALFLFALSPGHILPVAWLANRNAVVSATLALLGLAAHLRWREAGWRPGLPLSLLGFAGGLAGGESAVGALAYLAAYEAFGAPGALRSRLLALAPAALLGAGYVAVYRLTGSGAAGSGLYLDPLASPGAFLSAAPGRLLVLAGGQLAGVPADLWMALPALRAPQMLAGGLALLAAAALVRRAWPGLSGEERRAVRWLGTGMLLSMVPVLATFPLHRLLLVPSLGAAALLAVLLRHALASAAKADRRIAGALLFIHVAMAGFSWPFQIGVVAVAASAVERSYEEAEIDDAVAPHQRVVVFGFGPATTFYPGMGRALTGHPLPAAWWVVSLAPRDLELTRTGDRTLELAPIRAAMIEAVFEQLFRSSDRPFAAGETVRLAGLEVTVLAVDDGKPTRVQLAFDAPLEDPSLLFLGWRDGRLRRLPLPAVGRSMRLPRSFAM